MPNWKLVITSGSDAALNSLNVKTFVSASSFNGSFTGSLNGTASQAVSSSYALTASYALNGGAAGFPFSGSAQITGSLGVTGSFSVNGNTGQTVFASDADTLVISGSLIITGSASITGSLKVSGSITGSLFGTASSAVSSSYAYTASSAISSSFALTASYALFAANGGGGGVSAIYIQDEGITQGTASYFNFYGAGVTATVSDSTASINIPGGGGGTTNNASNAVLNQSSPAVTWSFTHNLGAKYPVFTVFDSNDNVIIPQQIKAVDTASALIYFSTARTGTAVASIAGNVLTSSYSISSSYAYTASSAVNSFTLNGTGCVGFATTASFTTLSSSFQQESSSQQQISASYIALSASYNIFSGSASTRITANSASIQTISSSLLQVSSSTQQVSASYIALSASYNVSSASLSTRVTANSASISSLNTVSGSFAVLAANQTFSGKNTFTSDITASNITITGTASIQYLDVVFQSSSIIYASGSNQLGDASNDTQTLWGTVNVISGPLVVTGSANFKETITGSITSATNATTASFALRGNGAFTGSFSGSISASFSGSGVGIYGIVSSSYAYTASSAINASASLTSISASYAATASYLLGYISPFPFTGSAQITGSLGVTGSVSATSFSGSFSGSGANLFGIPATAITGLNLSQISSGSVSASISPNFGLLINTSVSASNFTGSFTGSLTGIATSASYASFALTASFSLGGSGFPFSGSAVITGSFLVSQSLVDFSKSAGVTGSFTGSLFGTASYATFAISASFAPGFTTNMSQSVAATTWSFTHNLNTINPIVQVYDLTNSQIIPNQIVGMNNSTAEIRFDYAQAGYAVASNGGGLYVTGSTSTLVQTVGAATWSFTHNLNNKYNTYEVYDNNDYVLIPSAIKALTNNTAELYFAGLQTGRAVAQFSGINGAPNATTASYAVTATSSSYAATASYLNPITNSYVVLTQVSQSLNYVDDVAAAAGGVPLGGIYRNGNFILIRLS
jgi:hypothetical protein